MTAQETVDRFALLARPRLLTLLRLSTAIHIFDPAPGSINSQFVDNGATIALDRWKRNLQPYKDLQRFISDERVMRSVIDPGLLPIAKAISGDVLGGRILVTRRIAPRKGDKGVVAHVDGYGVRIMVHFDDEADETIVAWECLYGVS